MTVVSTLIWGLFYYSVLNAGIGVSFSLNYVAILIGMIFFGWLFAKETSKQEKFLSACIAIAGLALVSLATATEGANTLALGLAVISGLSIAAHTVLAKMLPYTYLVIFALASVLSSWLLLRGMGYVDAGIAGVIGALEIVFGIIFGVAFFDETIPALAYLGIITILVAAAFPYCYGRYRTAN